LLVELKARAGEFTAEVGAAKKEVKSALAEVDAETSKFSQKAKALGGGLSTVGKAAAIGLAGAAVAIGAEGIKSAIEYQESTAKIAASAGISQDAATKVGDAFLKTAGKSTFSGQEIAAAFGPVAGQLKLTEGHALSASESMTVMQAAMDAAEASGQDLGTTTADLAGVMQTFGLGVDQASGASDILYNTARNLNLPIDQVAQGMEKLKGRLGNLAPSMTDTATLLEELGQHGITGTRGVGVMQTALSTLMGGSKGTQDALKQLGVHLTDAKGNFVGMGSVISQLQPVLANMTQAQQTQALTSLFGASSAQVMQQVIAGGVSGFKTATDAVSKQGAAQEAAEKQAKSYQGEIKTAKAAISDLVTVLGEKLLPIMANVVEAIASGIRWFSQHKDIAIALGIGIATILVPAILMWVGGLIAAAAAEIAAMAPIILITAAIAALGIGIYELVTHWKQVWSDIKQWASDAWHFLDSKVFQPIGNFFVAVWRGFLDSAKKAWDDTWSAIKKALDTAWSSMKAVFETVVGFITGLPGKFASLGAHIWSWITSLLSDEWRGLQNIWSNVLSFITGLPGKIASATKGMWHGISDAFKDAIDFLIRGWNALHFKMPSVDTHIPGVGKIGGFDIGLPQIPMLANGGDVTRAGMAVVGERGPELLRLGAGAQVQPLPRQAAAGGGQSQPLVINLSVAGHHIGQAVVPDLLAFQRQGGVLAIDRFGNALAGV
jgi:TP901 family phage tail tape measure protein